ncbi:hypothetical protein PVAP13_7NG263424 [Panicum virgatum]|uniref:Kinesin-like protein n=1 Tax=Panicum virgatum TaxID=38727 RepID=A0A8T0QA23_PANVG|nr:hypothetical protein PVAP13_7NG263424 [Panicum virgatum]
MGAIGSDAPEQWDKVDGAEAANGGGGGGAGRLEKILVSVRLRPLNDNEIARGEPAEWECINDTTIISRSTFPDRPTAPTAYSFDRVFRSDCNTKEVYEEGAKAVALSVVSGINSSVFAYGQTSSGKTYTMTGITEHTTADIYDYIAKHEERAFVLKFSAIEIYNEVVRDLLTAESTSLRLWDDAEKGTYVENLTEVILRDSDHLKELISVCEAQRRTGETYLNENSSRSHQILKLTVESSAREFVGKDKSTTLVASVNFVDLAGSERASQALSAGTRLKEGCHINRSLLTLGTVIRKLSKVRNGHIPYRDSKLTRILQPSLGGNARTAIICTMSPARSHMEQSRNTLLFASCAKEVVTNAQVNVVMSDRALVKQLQRELARLESELRCPASYSALETLVKEKDNQIRKMEKEIKELKLQRDLAQSRLQDLLQVVGDNHGSKHPMPCEDEQSTASTVVSSAQNFRFQGRQIAQREYRSQQSENNAQLPLAYSVCSPPFSGMPPTNGRDDHSQVSNEDSEDLCKEVRCIETNETEENECLESSAMGSNSLQGSSMHGNNDPNPSVNSRQHDASPITLEQHLENVKKPYATLVMDLGSSTRNSSSSKVIGRSRSCRSLTASTLFEDLEKEDCTPPSRSFMDHPGRPEGCQRRVSALNYDTESETLSRAGSMLSEITTARDGLKANGSVAGDTEFAGIGEFVAELKEMAQVQYQKQHGDQGENGELAKGTIRSVGLDPIMDALQSPSRWPFEFEKKQQEIIDLWHGCNVSLVHRTYFFLLFKGDPADAIYMEVELRRLSFLKDTYSNGSMGRNVVAASLNTSLVSSAKKLQREREMLCRQMQKRLTIQERESMYTKWGVSLSSKRRRLQVARRVWTETKDLEHVRESASLVARLIGLLEPGKALREMFGLSFAPQQFTRRSHNSWRYGRSSLD